MELEIHVLSFCIMSEDVLERVKCIFQYFYTPHGFRLTIWQTKDLSAAGSIGEKEITGD